MRFEKTKPGPRPTHLTRYIRARRLELGLTQREVGATLGYTPQFITNWECGRSQPPDRALPKLARVLDIPLTRIFDLAMEERRADLARVFKPKRSGGGLFQRQGE